MASIKTYNTIDSKQQLLLMKLKKNEYGGYKQELLENSLIDAEIDFYVCTKCNGIMRNACQVGDEQSPVCEMCIVGRENTIQMLRSRKNISRLRAKCPLVNRGCMWKGIIGEIDAHLDECMELTVNCSNLCDVILKRSELMNHCENECLNRKVNCMHCKLIMEYKNISIHFTSCPELPSLCPNECLGTFLRKEMSSHIENDCCNTIIDCINECGLKMKRTELSIHCEKKCKHRRVSCEYCGITIQWKELESHDKVCPELPLICPNKCMEVLIRKKIESHVEKECPNTLVTCPYKEMGCKSIMIRCKLQEHEITLESHHFRITKLYYSNKVKSLESQIEDKDDKIKQLTAKVQNLETNTIEEDDQKLFTPKQLDMSRALIPVSVREPRRKPKYSIRAEHKKNEIKIELSLSQPLPRRITEHLKIGFLYVYKHYESLYLPSDDWQRCLVALAERKLLFYNSAKDYSRAVSDTLKIETWNEVYFNKYDNEPDIPGIPEGCASKSGFVVQLAFRKYYFVTDNLKNANSWVELMKNQKEMKGMDRILKTRLKFKD